MPCFNPLTAYQCEDKRIVFDERKGAVVRTLLLSCGQCIGCRLERSRQWAVRCLHEAQMHKRNCFVTLTFSSDAVWNLDYRDYQLFMKRLRKDSDGPVRFYMCGEYGEQFGRPHFHACLFGKDFEDKAYWSKSPGGSKLYRSARLERLWPHGFSSVGEVNFESAAYVARYITKKITGAAAARHYEKVDLETGEILQRTPEFNKMSLKPGIGSAWLSRYFGDVFPEGRVVARGVKMRSPRYYDGKFKLLDPDAYEDMAFGRHLEAQARFSDNTVARLRVKEKVQMARAKMLKRTIS